MPAPVSFFDYKQVSVSRSMVMLAAGALVGLVIAGYGLFTAKGTRTRGVPPEAIALVNQRQILRSDFMTQAQAEFTVPFAQTTRAQRDKVLDDMINEELLMQRGLEIDLPSYDPDVRTALVAGVELEVTAEVIAQQPTTEELRTFYEAHKERYSSEALMQLRDLLLQPKDSQPIAAARAMAGEAAAALRRGQALDAVKARYGMVDSGRFVDSGHVDLGDIYGFAVHAKVDATLEAAIVALKDGEVSEPVEQNDGVHVIVMRRHQFPVAESFEEATNRVWTDVKTAAQNKVRAANLAYLRGRAEIVVAPEAAR
jgi:parvulin-like peptidyl-prolyl isomerase